MMEGEEELNPELNLELTLGGNWDGPRYLPDLNVEDPHLNICLNIGGFRTYTLRREVAETQQRVCTRLELCFSFNQWVEKTLPQVDIGRVTLGLWRPWIVNTVLPTMPLEARQALQQHNQINVEVYDTDIQSTRLDVTLLRQQNGRFYFGNAWLPGFVVIRSLIVGDTIGLYWEAGRQRFLFRVLRRAPRTEDQLGPADDP